MAPLSSSQSDLAARYIPLATRMARRFRYVFPRERPDFRSAAYLGLCQAARRFDPAVGVDFATYARHWIDGAMRRHRAHVWDGRPEHLPADILDTARPVWSDLDDRDAAIDLIRRLPGKHRHLCRLLYLDGLDRRAAARVMGLSKARVSRLHNEAMRLMRRQAA